MKNVKLRDMHCSPSIIAHVMMGSVGMGTTCTSMYYPMKNVKLRNMHCSHCILAHVMMGSLEKVLYAQVSTTP